MNRERNYYRTMRRKHIARKYRIVHDCWREDYWNTPRLKGMLSKGKVHCSCWLCSGKTKVRGYSAHDLRANAREHDFIADLITNSNQEVS